MYAKIFTQIFDSSVNEDCHVRWVFEDMMKLADVNGVVDMTHEAIARRTNAPLDIVKKGIERLEMPDDSSRNPDYEGRRIVRLDEHRSWGWWIVNYEYYRNLASEEQKRARTRERVRKFRQKSVTPCNADVTRANGVYQKCNAKKKEMEKHKEKEEAIAPDGAVLFDNGVEQNKETTLNEENSKKPGRPKKVPNWVEWTKKPIDRWITAVATHKHAVARPNEKDKGILNRMAESYNELEFKWMLIVYAQECVEKNRPMNPANFEYCRDDCYAKMHKLPEYDESKLFPPEPKKEIPSESLTKEKDVV